MGPDAGTLDAMKDIRGHRGVVRVEMQSMDRGAYRWLQRQRPGFEQNRNWKRRNQHRHRPRRSIDEMQNPRGQPSPTGAQRQSSGSTVRDEIRSRQNRPHHLQRHRRRARASAGHTQGRKNEAAELPVRRTPPTQAPSTRPAAKVGIYPTCTSRVAQTPISPTEQLATAARVERRTTLITSADPAGGVVAVRVGNLR